MLSRRHPSWQFSTEHSPHGRQRFLHVILAAALTIAGAATAVGQESRGTISGRVVDTSGGVLPGVTVTIVNTGTNATNTVVTSDGGQFSAPLLISGTYRVTVELSGFRTVVRESVDVRVGDRLQVDFTLEPASVSTEILVTAQAPLLDTGTATMGQVIDSKLIGEMPLGDGTAYGLARLVPGASFERSYALQRPMDNDNLRGLTISGTINSEFTIDGSSNIVSGARVGIQPPSDSIQEFKSRRPSTTRRLATPAPATSTSRSRAAPTSGTAPARSTTATTRDRRPSLRRIASAPV